MGDNTGWVVIDVTDPPNKLSRFGGACVAPLHGPDDRRCAAASASGHLITRRRPNVKLCKLEMPEKSAPVPQAR